MKNLPFVLSKHAAVVIEQRQIDPEWIALVLAHPAKREPDRVDPILLHVLAPIQAFGGRVLRVVYNPSTQPLLVVTAYFDRAMKGSL